MPSFGTQSGRGPGPPPRPPRRAGCYGLIDGSLVVLQLEDLPLGLGQLHFQSGILVQTVLDLAAEVFTGLLLLEELIRNIHGRQHRRIGAAQMPAVHHAPHLGVHQFGTALDIALCLLGHHGVLLTRDGDGNLVFHPEFLPTSLILARSPRFRPEIAAESWHYGHYSIVPHI